MSSVLMPCVPSLVVHGMLVQLVLADFGVSHRLSAVVEGLGPSAVSAAGRAGTSLTGERLTTIPCVVVSFLRLLKTPFVLLLGVTTVLVVPGGQALGPFQWQAPEVCNEIVAVSGSQAATLATTPSDVYMLGAYQYSG